MPALVVFTSSLSTSFVLITFPSASTVVKISLPSSDFIAPVTPIVRLPTFASTTVPKPNTVNSPLASLSCGEDSKYSPPSLIVKLPGLITNTGRTPKLFDATFDTDPSFVLRTLKLSVSNASLASSFIVSLNLKMTPMPLGLRPRTLFIS